MKSYYLILIENFVGIIYLILFLLGFFTDNLNFYHIGGIGVLIFMFIMIKGQPKNLFSFLIICGIGCLIAYFVSKWWLGIFWVSAFFTVGQLFGIRALLKSKKQLITQIDEQTIETEDLFKYAMTGKTADPDKIEIIEILFFLGLILGPYLLANYLN